MNDAQMVLYNLSRNVKRRMNKLLGNVSLVKPIIDRLQINEVFEKIMKDCSKRENISNGLASEVMVLNRLTAPMPMYNIQGWVDNESCVGDIYQVATGSMNDDRIADLLDDVHTKIPEAK